MVTMTNRMSKRLLAILLSLILLLSLIPMAFAAEDEEQGYDGDGQASLLDDDLDDFDLNDLLDGVYVIIMSSGYDMEVGETMTINDAMVSGDGDLTYKWTSSNSSVAAVSGSGESASVTAKGEGTATITLTVTRASDGDSDSDSVTINVKNAASTPVTARADGSTNLSIKATESQTVSVSASGGSGNYYYAWEESGAVSLALSGGSGNTITGRYGGTGSVTVTVSDRNDPSNYATVTWNVTVTEETTTPLTVHISQNEMTLSAGAKETLTLYAEGGSGNPSNYEYYWNSNNPGVASISGSGKTVTVTAANSVRGSSSAEISGYVRDKATGTTSETSYCGVIVKNSEATYNGTASATVGSSLALNNIALAISGAYADHYNDTLSYSASVRIFEPSGSAGYLCLQDGTRVGANNSYTYAIMQDMIFQPTAAGTFTTNYSVTQGGNSVSGRITISVTGGGEVTAASLSPSSIRMETYSSVFLTLNVSPARASYTVTWSSSDTRIATVSGSGSTVTVYSQGRNGSCNIVASIRSGGGTLTRTCPVTVYTDTSSKYYSPSLTVTLGSDYYDHGISDSLAKQWRSYFGVTLGDDARISFGSLGTTRYGTLHLNNGNQIRANTSYTFQDLRDMYFESYAAGTFTIPYTLTYRGDEMTGNFNITIRASSLNVTISPSSLNLTPYSTQYVNVSVSPSSAYYRVSWSSSNTSVATVSGSGTSAAVTAKGISGTATITATVTDANGTAIYRTCSVRVSGTASSYYDPTITIPLGQIYTKSGTADAMASQYRNVYGSSLDYNKAIIRFSSMGDSKIGILHMPNGSAARINTDYTLEQYANQMYVETVSSGTYRLPYTLTYNGKSLTGTASFVISTGSVNCTLTLKDSLPYQFSTSLTGGPGGTQLSNSITNAVGSSWTYIRFSSSSGTVGNLYLNNRSAALTPTTNVTSQAMNDLYFVPARPGTFSAPFSVYSSNGKLADGTLYIVVPGSASSTFTDVPANAYYADAVTWALQNEITTGTTPTTFSPNASVTRGQAVTFLWRAMGRPVVSNVYNPFKDVAADEYYTQAVLWAVQQGITNGTSDTTFSPNDTLAQDQMLTFLCRASGGTAGGADWSNMAMSWAQGRGLFNGRPGVPGAKDPCPRCDVVYYLWKNAQ